MCIGLLRVSTTYWEHGNGQKKNAPDQQEEQPAGSDRRQFELGKARAPVALVAYDKESQAAQFDMRQ